MSTRSRGLQGERFRTSASTLSAATLLDSGAPTVLPCPRRSRRAHYRGRASPSQRRGPDPRAAARSPGFDNGHRSSERHPHPMHSERLSRRCWNSAIRSSIRAFQVGTRRSQSAREGAPSFASPASCSPMSPRLRPMRWAKTMKATSRRVARGYTRYPEGFLSGWSRPRSS